MQKIKAFNEATNYQTLFPNEVYNNISEEYSVYGPGAYLVYLLEKATDKKLINHEVKRLELLNRRADLNQLQINETSTNKECYYLEGVVNLLLNTLNDWQDEDKNIWKKTTDENQLWQYLAEGTASFIPYNKRFEIIKNRFDLAEIPLADITAKLLPESYNSLSWIYTRLGLNHSDVEILKTGGGDVSTWLNNKICTGQLFHSNFINDRELINLIESNLLADFNINEILISEDKNDVYFFKNEKDLKILRCFIILANAIKWKCSTLIQVLRILDIHDFNSDNTDEQLKYIANLSLIAEVFEDLKNEIFLNKSIIKNRLTSVNLSYLNKTTQSKNTSEDIILNFLKDHDSKKIFYRFFGKIKALKDSNNLNNNSHEEYIKLTKNNINDFFNIAMLIKKIQQTGYTLSEFSNFITALIELKNDQNEDFKEFFSKISDKIEYCEQSKKIKYGEINENIENILSTLWGVEESIIFNYINNFKINSNINFKKKFEEYLKVLYKFILFTKNFAISKEVASIGVCHLQENDISENANPIVYFEYYIGVLYLQNYFDESLDDNSNLASFLISTKECKFNDLFQEIAARDNHDVNDLKKILGSTNNYNEFYQNLYKIVTYGKLEKKLQLSITEIYNIINDLSCKNSDIILSLISSLSDDFYGKQLIRDRDILIPLVLQKLSKDYEDIINLDHLSEYLLIDVQATDELKITPVREAINAVQWYMANVKCKLEVVESELVNNISADEWLYIEKFRVWQAEKKLELYPNEYFQIDNLDTESDLYKQLKSKLQGDKLREDIIKSSLIDYLDKWSGFTMNEIVASHMYKYNDKYKICFLAKCKIEANAYYFADTEIDNARLKNTSEWIKINTHIEADLNTLNIIFAFNKYYIFYTKLNTEKQNENDIYHYLKTCYIYQKNSSEWSAVNELNTIKFKEDNFFNDDPMSEYRFKPIVFFSDDSILIDLSVSTKLNDILESNSKWFKTKYVEDSGESNEGYTMLYSGKISIHNKIVYSSSSFINISLNDLLIVNNTTTNNKNDILYHLKIKSQSVDNIMSYKLLSQGIFDFNLYNNIKSSEGIDEENDFVINFYNYNNLDNVSIYNLTGDFVRYNNFIKIEGINGYLYNTNLNSYIIIDYNYNNFYSIKKGDYDKFDVKSKISSSFFILPYINQFSFFIRDSINVHDVLEIYDSLSIDKVSETDIIFNQSYTYDAIKEINSTKKITHNAKKYLTNSFDTIYAKEFFVYIPCLIATYLRNNLQYEEAIKWLERVFNPHKKEMDVLKYFYDESDSGKIFLKKWLFEQYVTTLFDWADYDFRAQSWESINHAMQLYLQLEELLGEEINVCDEQIKLHEKDRTWSKISADLKDKRKSKEVLDVYFGVPSHNTINELRKKVQLRLYNLRHVLNIDGSQFTPLEYGEVIDPVSVKLLRNTNSLNSQGLQELQSIKKIYQFRDLMPITESIIDTAIQFGNQFYSILQQKDNEEIQLLMQTQTMAAELFVIQNFDLQIEEIELQLKALIIHKKSVQEQNDFYLCLKTSGIIEQERESFNIQKNAHKLQLVANTVRSGATVAHLLPNTFGLSNGGMKFGSAIEATANVTDMIASHMIQVAQIITDEADAKRRILDLEKEIKINEFNLEEITINIQATKKRLEIIKSNLLEHKMRINQQQTMLNHLTVKFTNVDLYSWMTNKISSLYSSVYQIAFNSLNQLQNAYNYELVRKDTFLPKQPCDRNELLVGEGLKLALIQLKDSYFRNNIRRKEVEKIVSLRKKLSKNNTADWESFLNENKEITFNLIKSDFYDNKLSQLRIKSLSISVPGIVGPYESFEITLKNNILKQEIEISRGINDFGVFPESINDGRYMPFEGFEINDETTDKNSKEWSLSVTKSKESKIVISDIIFNVKLQILNS